MGEAREIFLAACQKVAEALEPDGFRYRKSRAELVKKDGDLTFIVRFQSSRRNIVAPGDSTGFGLSLVGKVPVIGGLLDLLVSGNVGFIAHVAVEDRRVGNWRPTLRRPLRNDALIASTNIGYLMARGAWLELNLANPRMRDRRIAETIALIRDSGFPYFDLFRDPPSVVSRLAEKPIAGMMDIGEIEYAVHYAGPEAGREVLGRYFRELPGSEERYREALREFRDIGIPSAWSSTAGPRLAQAALALGIEAESRTEA